MAGKDKSFEIVVAEPYDATAIARLEEIGRVTVLDDASPERLLEAVTGADALLVRTRARVTARIIDAAPRLKAIGRASPCLDHLDLRAAQRRGITVVYAPHIAVNSTAEFAFALLLALERRFCYYNHKLMEGEFDSVRAAPITREVRGLTLGLLGMDAVAEALGRLCKRAFDMPVLFHDPLGRVPSDLSARGIGLDDLLSTADMISVHLPASPATKGLLNAERIGRMKPTAVLVNTSRGCVIDTVALAHALKKGKLAGAGLDVFETEPLPADHPLRQAPNCILTPHIAGVTHEASAERFHVVEDVVRVLTGQTPRFPAPLSAG